ncbi:hypothetical protein TNCT_481181 [Trichonephila clavata]|uniref:Uncharacterized protein n=1 Tax=Trichonephila clavata TaxID=2740835 RepID=A0A8X6FBG2_TRICU|nr:hypothetical protein TNCT_481181 [Trichonephila clavata]
MLHQLFTINLVQLHNLGASIFRISIIGAPTFRIKLWVCKSGEGNSRTQWDIVLLHHHKDAVYGLIGIFLPWKRLLNGDIDLLNHIISACKNCSVRKPVLILEVLLNVKIHLGQRFVRIFDNFTTWNNDEAC